MANNLLHKPVQKALMLMAAPAAFGMLMTFLFQLVDSYFVGQLGTAQLAAISFAYPIYLLIVSFVMGTAAGVSATVAKALGEQNQIKAQLLTTLSLLVFMFLTLIFGLGGYGFSHYSIDVIFVTLGASEQILPLIRDYMLPLYVGMFALVGSLIANAALMAKGVMLQATVVMALGGLINLVLDYVLIFGVGPIPAMALTGAAWATVISWCAMLVMMLVLLFKQQLLSLTASTSLLQACAALREVQRLAVPAIAAQVLNPVAIAVITRFVSQSGEDAVAAYGLVTRLESLGLVGVLALSVIMTPFVAQNYGAKQMQRLGQVITYSGRMVVYWGLVFYLVMLLLVGQVAAIFTDNATVIQHSREYFYIVGLSLPVFGLTLITTSFFNGVQQASSSLKLTLVKSLVLSIPFAMFGAYFGLYGIWIGLALANIVSAVYATRLLRQWQAKNDLVIAYQTPLLDYWRDVKSSIP